MAQPLETNECSLHKNQRLCVRCRAWVLRHSMAVPTTRLFWQSCTWGPRPCAKTSAFHYATCATVLAHHQQPRSCDNPIGSFHREQTWSIVFKATNRIVMMLAFTTDNKDEWPVMTARITLANFLKGHLGLYSKIILQIQSCSVKCWLDPFDGVWGAGYDLPDYSETVFVWLDLYHYCHIDRQVDA